MSATKSAAGLDLAAREREVAFVVLLLGVDEDDVEDVLDLRERLVRVALDELRPLLEARVCDVRAPRLDLLRVGSRESTRPPRLRTPAASQIVE